MFLKPSQGYFDKSLMVCQGLGIKQNIIHHKGVAPKVPISSEVEPLILFI